LELTLSDDKIERFKRAHEMNNEV